MEHQDWSAVKLNKKKDIKPAKQIQNKGSACSQLTASEPIGKLIAQSRMTQNMNQKQFALNIGISQQILSRWEANKELPNNSQIALIEKITKVKLPRCQKVVVGDD